MKNRRVFFRYSDSVDLFNCFMKPDACNAFFINTEVSNTLGGYIGKGKGTLILLRYTFMPKQKAHK